MKRHVTICIILVAATARLLPAELASQPTASSSFVIDKDGMLYGWGRNDFGQVGNGSISVAPYVSEPFGIVPPPGASGWKRISAGWGHTIAIADNDQLYAWGFNASGRLGTGRSTNETLPTPVSLPAGVTAWGEIAAGGSHNLAIGNDGKVYAWGANDWGQLGIGGAGSVSVPVAINLPTEVGNWAAVAAGSAHSLALSHSGQLFFWGRSVGTQEVVTVKPPTQIPLPEDANRWTAIGAGYNHSFAIASSGKLYAWGANESGQLGIGSTASADSPSPVTTNRNWVAAAGGLRNSVALDASGMIYEWGWLRRGENPVFTNVPPHQVSTVGCASGWRNCTAGYGHRLAITSNCKLFGWGTNDFGQLPGGAASWQPFPRQIAGLKDVCLNVENHPPTIYLTTDGVAYNSPAKIRISATIFDCEANVEALMFYEGENVLSIMTTEVTNWSNISITFVWSNVTAGTYELSAAAVDQFGARATSLPVTVTVYAITNGITDIGLTTNALELAGALRLWDCGGLEVQSTFVSAQALDGAISTGIFQTTPPLTHAYGLAGPGIIISTGNAAEYTSGVSRSIGNTTAYGSRASAAQESILDRIENLEPGDYAHYDVTEFSLYFDVLAGYDRIQMRLVFGSEEYPEFIGSHFADTFGILLNGTNLAFLNGRAISLNHPDMQILPGTELDGVLAPGNNPQLMLSADVVPGSSNNVLTFILADTTDAIVDTTVYVSELRALAAGQESAELRVDIAAASASELTLQVSGIPCGQAVIESSPDLLQWTDISTNATQNGIARLTVPYASQPAFFRARRLR